MPTWSTPSRALARGPEFEEISLESAFAGCEYLESGWRTHRLTGKAAILKAMRACQEADEDEAHWSGPDGELLEAVARGEVEPRIRVVRVVSMDDDESRTRGRVWSRRVE